MEAVLGFCAAVGPGPVAMGWLAGLDPAGLSCGARVDLLACWEAQAAWLAAAQARALAGMDAPDGLPGPGDEDWVREEVAAALHLSGVTAHRRLQVARALAHRLPGTREALAAGRVDSRKATAIAEATEPLDPATAAGVEAAVLPEAGAQTLAELKRAVRRAVLAADPAAAETRHQTARAGRYVRLYPAEDGMADLYAHLPAGDATRLMATLDTLAAQHTAGDPRDIDARRADALIHLADRGGPERRGGGRGGGRDGGGRDGGGRGGGVLVQVTVAAATLAGHDDQPGELAGYGPITAATARQLAAAATRHRLLPIDPATGRLHPVDPATGQPLPDPAHRHRHRPDTGPARRPGSGPRRRPLPAHPRPHPPPARPRPRLRLPRLQHPRPPLRPRPHHPLAHRTHHPGQPRRPLPTPPPPQTRNALATHPPPRRHPHLDQPRRQDLPGDTTWLRIEFDRRRRRRDADARDCDRGVRWRGDSDAAR